MNDDGDDEKEAEKKGKEGDDSMMIAKEKQVKEGKDYT